VRETGRDNLEGQDRLAEGAELLARVGEQLTLERSPGDALPALQEGFECLQVMW